MSKDQEIVLPDTLVVQLIDNAATLSKHLQHDFEELGAQREALRKQLIDERKIIRVDPGQDPLDQTLTIDGAHLAEIDRASAYSASCAVRVGNSDGQNDQNSCLAILPHVPSLNSLSSGLMMMQEIMMAVSVIEEFPEATCMFDGSRISAIININQFYTGIARDLPGQLKKWRNEAKDGTNREPAKTLSLFESRDWMSPFLRSPQIVGNLKLVTTTKLLGEYAPGLVGRFDDKTFASLVLEDGEAMEPVSLPSPDEPYHISEKYPYAKDISALEGYLTEPYHDNQLWHIYYRPNQSHGVFKIEVNGSFLKDSTQTAALLSWWRHEMVGPDLQEPYGFYIADRFAKESVNVARNALREISRRDMAPSSWAWFFTQPYRSE